MRSIFTGLMLLLSTFTYGQFKLKGRIVGGMKPDSVFINIPFVYGYYLENTISIAVDRNGYFSKTIKINQQRFATINVNRKIYTLLLAPGKSLNIMINGADTSIVDFHGTSAKENKLLYDFGFEEIPFFSRDTLYARLSMPQLKLQVIQKWFAIRDENLKRVGQSGLTEADKRLISQEISSNATVQLNDFARGVLATGRKQVFELVLEIYKNASLKPLVIPAGPQYYAFADSYIGYLETLAFKDLPDDAFRNPKTFVKYYNVTIDSGNRIAQLKGKSFLKWTLVHNEFDKVVAEHWLAQAIDSKYINKDLPQARPLMEELQQYYPHSIYLPALKVKIQKLDALLSANASNKDIVIAEGFEKMTSIYEVIKKMQGKVVYLDIWGTWCGPCKPELKFNPELKQYFRGKDVAFVYLDMDDDEKDSQWREFIKVNGMTGMHLRKNKEAIQSFWNELKPNKETRYYPTYFIFDKSGRLVEADAKQQSEREELYKQIEQYVER
jgi:thiol-disulfide isomerase/thioredoxin